MKLTVSNIAWPQEADEEVLAWLVAAGITAVEVAPTRVWPNWALTEQDVTAYRDYLAAKGLQCSSLQAILYQQPELQVFGTNEQRRSLVAHLKAVADLAATLGAGPMVFGAPKNRDRGDLDDQTAFHQAADLFAEVGDYCQQKGVCLCLEPNPTAYNCNFITDSRSGAELVRAVNSPGFRLHLDAAGMHLAGEAVGQAIAEAIDVLAHIHISEPNLGSFDQPQVDHPAIAQTLRSLGWNRWISIEMRATDSPLAGVKQALSVVKEVYQVP